MRLISGPFRKPGPASKKINKPVISQSNTQKISNPVIFESDHDRNPKPVISKSDKETKATNKSHAPKNDSVSLSMRTKALFSEVFLKDRASQLGKRKREINGNDDNLPYKRSKVTPEKEQEKNDETSGVNGKSIKCKKVSVVLLDISKSKNVSELYNAAKVRLEKPSITSPIEENYDETDELRKIQEYLMNDSVDVESDPEIESQSQNRGVLESSDESRNKEAPNPSPILEIAGQHSGKDGFEDLEVILPEPVVGRASKPIEKSEEGKRSEARDNSNVIGKLQEFCVAKGLPNPIYELKEATGKSHNLVFTYQVKVAEVSMTAEGHPKKAAKRLAAENMQEKLNEIFNPSSGKENPVTEKLIPNDCQQISDQVNSLNKGNADDQENVSELVNTNVHTIKLVKGSSIDKSPYMLRLIEYYKQELSRVKNEHQKKESELEGNVSTAKSLLLAQANRISAARQVHQAKSLEHDLKIKDLRTKLETTEAKLKVQMESSANDKAKQNEEFDEIISLKAKVREQEEKIQKQIKMTKNQEREALKWKEQATKEKNAKVQFRPEPDNSVLQNLIKEQQKEMDSLKSVIKTSQEERDQLETKLLKVQADLKSKEDINSTIAHHKLLEAPNPKKVLSETKDFEARKGFRLIEVSRLFSFKFICFYII